MFCLGARHYKWRVSCKYTYCWFSQLQCWRLSQSTLYCCSVASSWPCRRWQGGGSGGAPRDYKQRGHRTAQQGEAAPRQRYAAGSCSSNPTAASRSCCMRSDAMQGVEALRIYSATAACGPLCLHSVVHRHVAFVLWAATDILPLHCVLSSLCPGRCTCPHGLTAAPSWLLQLTCFCPTVLAMRCAAGVCVVLAAGQ